VFSRQVCGGALSQGASASMMDLLRGAWGNFGKQLETPEGCSRVTEGSPGGSGCLIPILLLVTSGVTMGICLIM